MASLCVKTDGKKPSYEIQFFHQGRRKTIYLGSRYSEKTARELLKIVETLIYLEDNAISIPDKKTFAWLETACDDIKNKLAKHKLIQFERERICEELWADFLASKTDIKESTMKTYKEAKKRFFQFFDKQEELRDITPARIGEWKAFLISNAPRAIPGKLGLAEATTAGTFKCTKSAFNWAKRQGWIEQSPLSGIGGGSYENHENDRFVEMWEYEQLIDACPCQDWRTIIALARIGGLRCPSEVIRLQWSDVNWEKNRFYVRSSKTERYKKKGVRLVPIFPELRYELERLFEMESSIGKEFVINRYRRPTQNLATTFSKIVTRAGIQPIQRPFDNMRASRSTEVFNAFGPKVESEWIGHSQKIALRHYIQVTEADFERAIAGNFEMVVGAKSEKSNFPCTENAISLHSKKIPCGIPCTNASQ